MAEAIQHGLVSGLILSVYLSVLFVALALINPEMWLRDYPPDIQAAFGPMSAKANRQRWILGVPVLAGALGIVVVATIRFVASLSTSPGFGEVFVHTLIMLVVFNVVDLVLIDWLLFVRIRPKFVILPGTEGLAGYDDYGFHWHAFLKGTVGILVVSVIVSFVVMAAN